LAKVLHKKDPDQFSDPNHKPEIAVALTEFKAFVGWKPLGEIEEIFKSSILLDFVPEGDSSWTDKTLRVVVRAILHADDAKVQNVHNALAKAPREEIGNYADVIKLLPMLQEQHSRHDPGNLVALLCMDYMVLQPGEALFIPADGIHAYVSGDILECMARSDNMLVSGLCSPRVDKRSIDVFSDAMTFETHSKRETELPKKESSSGKNGKTAIYSPPIEEFDVLLTELANGEKEVLIGADGPSVAIVTKGEGSLEADGKKLDVKEGYIYFVASGVEVTWSAASEGLQVFTAVG
jgi:mannose-6-phosphate isomerase